MIEVKITDEMLLKAREKATEMGRLKNSILRGGGNVAGFLGEIIAEEALNAKENNTYNYDLTMKDGKTVDVKTKQTSVKPKPHYGCTVSKASAKQQCDYYAFVRVKNDFTVGWFLGMMPKQEFLDKAKFWKKGDLDTDNNYVVRADCYTLSIAELNGGSSETET